MTGIAGLKYITGECRYHAPASPDVLGFQLLYDLQRP